MKNALIAEFIGTFFLYLMIGMCVTPPAAAGVAVPLAIGGGLHLAGPPASEVGKSSPGL